MLFHSLFNMALWVAVVEGLLVAAATKVGELLGELLVEFIRQLLEQRRLQ